MWSLNEFRPLKPIYVRHFAQPLHLPVIEYSISIIVAVIESSHGAFRNHSVSLNKQLPKEAKELEKELRQITKEKNEAVRGQDFVKYVGFFEFGRLRLKEWHAIMALAEGHSLVGESLFVLCCGIEGG
ncbi:hypothetical protein Tco_0878268 [Tanacetum coccineum]|uniref:Uncharacterized protein n=1 Tax=Tanacetum coccineum TaxID=301880 RepID=A0ABQ5C0F6_9ASTR